MRGRCPVWVLDEDPLRRETTLEALRKVECVSLESTPVSNLKDDMGIGGCVVYFTQGIANSSALSLVPKLAERLNFVICVPSGSPEWGLATSCRLLLAGATEVIDAPPGLVLERIQQRVGSAAQSVLAAQAEQESLQRMMAKVGFAGRSSAIMNLFRIVRRVSSLSDLPVLITGETGTGKELLALAIHLMDSKRSRHPFVPVNCAALPDQLSESELFGHQKGAFTGAERERAGLLRSAEGGVLFLDEIGELSTGLQGKLLRVLQDRNVRSVGADREVGINVRVIAATHRHLDEMVAIGSFREDLFHRLNVLSLHIPPLRERAADIQPLVQFFVEKYRELWHPKETPAIGWDFIQALERSTLPGNARQIENVVRRAVLHWHGNGPLSLGHLPPEIWQEISAFSEASQCSEKPCSQAGETLESSAIKYLKGHGWNLPDAVRYLESLMVREALNATGGNQSKAARLLGITPRSVYNKLHRYCSP